MMFVLLHAVQQNLYSGIRTPQLTRHSKEHKYDISWIFEFFSRHWPWTSLPSSLIDFFDFKRASLPHRDQYLCKVWRFVTPVQRAEPEPLVFGDTGQWTYKDFLLDGLCATDPPETMPPFPTDDTNQTLRTWAARYCVNDYIRQVVIDIALSDIRQFAMHPTVDNDPSKVKGKVIPKGRTCFQHDYNGYGHWPLGESPISVASPSSLYSVSILQPLSIFMWKNPILSLCVINWSSQQILQMQSSLVSRPSGPSSLDPGRIFNKKVYANTIIKWRHPQNFNKHLSVRKIAVSRNTRRKGQSNPFNPSLAIISASGPTLSIPGWFAPSPLGILVAQHEYQRSLPFQPLSNEQSISSHPLFCQNMSSVATSNDSPPVEVPNATLPNVTPMGFLQPRPSPNIDMIDPSLFSVVNAV